jgi:hypothetical protein
MELLPLILLSPVLAAVAYFDLRYMRIPNGVVLSASGFGNVDTEPLVQGVTRFRTSIESRSRSSWIWSSSPTIGVDVRGDADKFLEKTARKSGSCHSSSGDCTRVSNAAMKRATCRPSLTR